MLLNFLNVDLILINFYVPCLLLQDVNCSLIFLSLFCFVFFIFFIFLMLENLIIKKFTNNVNFSNNFGIFEYFNFNIGKLLLQNEILYFGNKLNLKLNILVFKAWKFNSLFFLFSLIFVFILIFMENFYLLQNKNFIIFYLSGFVFMCIFFFIFKNTVLTDFLINFEIPFLYTFSFFSLFFALLTNNFFIIFIFLEIFIYCIYILINLKREYIFNKLTLDLNIISNVLNIEAGLKYFLYGAINSLFFILGLCLLCIPNIILNITVFQYYILLLVPYLTDVNNIFIGIFILITYSFIIFFLFKLSIVPFHWWIMDIFEAISYTLLAYISIPSKIIILCIMLQFFNIIFFYFFHLFKFFIFYLAILTMIIGAFGMLFQNNIKRFLAYSTLNNMAYILLGFGFNNDLGNTAIYIYILSYSLMMIVFITIISNYIDKKTNSAPMFFNQLIFLKKHYFLLACIFGINIFSMIGLPPFAGFWGKFYILSNIIQNINDIVYIVILIIIIITSIISAYAYLIILKKMFFFSDLGTNTLYVKPISKFIYICIISLFIWSCFLWINII